MISLGEKITIELNEINNDFIKQIKENKNVIDVTTNNNIVHIAYYSKEGNLENLIDYLRKNNVSYTSLFSERPTLNDVFLNLTGKELRD